jgi:hypothetical protein
MFRLRCAQFAIGLLVLASQCDCSRSRAQDRHVAEACGILAQSMANQESTFVARAQAIRGTHLLLPDYDRQMIALLEERRTAIRSTLLTDASADEGVSGCSGRPLEDLRREAQQEMVRLQGFLDTFKRALREDPAEVFIDAR